MRKSALIVMSLLLSSGCQIVHVQDTDGKAIAFATVSSGVQGSKFASMPTQTDLLGNALLPMGMGAGDEKWVAISKEGYIPIRITRPAEGRIDVTLRRAGSSGRGFVSMRAPSGRGVSETTRLRGTPAEAQPARVTVPRKKIAAPPAGE